MIVDEPTEDETLAILEGLQVGGQGAGMRGWQLEPLGSRLLGLRQDGDCVQHAAVLCV